MAASHGLSKDLALDLGDLELPGGGLAGAIGAGKRSRAPGPAAVNLAQVGHDGECLGVAKRHVNDTVVGQGGHGGDSGGLLAATKAARGQEHAGKLAVVAALGPDAAGLVPEGLTRGVASRVSQNSNFIVRVMVVGCHVGVCRRSTYLPLGREVAVSRGDTKEKGVVGLEGLWIAEDRDVSVLGGGVHLGQDLIREGFLDLEEVDLGAGLFGTLFLGQGELLDVAVHGVLSERGVMC